MKNKFALLVLVLFGFLVLAGCGKVAQQTSDQPIVDLSQQANVSLGAFIYNPTQNLITAQPDINWNYGEYVSLNACSLIDYEGYVSGSYTIATEVTVGFPLTKASYVGAIKFNNGVTVNNYFDDFDIYVVNTSNQQIQVYHGESGPVGDKLVTFNPVQGNSIRIQFFGTNNRAHFLVKGVYGQDLSVGYPPTFGSNGVQVSNGVTYAWLGAYAMEEADTSGNLTANLYWAKSGTTLQKLATTTRAGSGMLEFNSATVPNPSLNALESETTYNYKFEVVDNDGQTISQSGTIRTGTNPPQLGTGGVQQQNGDNWAWVGAFVSEPGDSSVILTGKLFWGTTSANKTLLATVTRNNEGMIEFNSTAKPIAALNALITGRTYYYTTEFSDDDGQKITNTGTIVTLTSPPIFGASGVEKQIGNTWAWIGAYCSEPNDPTSVLIGKLYWGTTSANKTLVATVSRNGDGMLEFNTATTPLAALNNLTSETTYYYAMEVTDDDGQRVTGNGSLTTPSSPPVLGTGGVQKQNGDSWAWLGAYVSEPGDATAVLTGKLYWGTTSANKTLLATVTRTGEGMLEFNSTSRPIAALNNLTAGRTYYYTVEFSDDDAQKITTTGTIFTTTSRPIFGTNGIEKQFGSTWAWLGAYVTEPNDATALLTGKLYWGTTSANKTLLATVTRTGDGMIEFNSTLSPIAALNALNSETNYYYAVEVTDDDGQKVSSNGSLKTSTELPAFGADGVQVIAGNTWAWIGAWVLEPADASYRITGRLYFGSTSENMTLISTKSRTGAGMLEFNNTGSPILQLNILTSKKTYHYRYEITDDDGQKVSRSGAFTTL